MSPTLPAFARVVVTGGRKFADEARVHEDLRLLLPGLLRVAHGCAVGADAAAGAWARRWLRPDGHVGYQVDTTVDGPWPAAGCRRNARMLTAETPDLVLAYPDPKSRGTWHCVAEALCRGIPVVVWAPWAIEQDVIDALFWACLTGVRRYGLMDILLFDRGGARGVLTHPTADKDEFLPVADHLLDLLDPLPATVPPCEPTQS